TTSMSCRTRCADREVLAPAVPSSLPSPPLVRRGRPSVPALYGGVRPGWRRPELLWREPRRQRRGRRRRTHLRTRPPAVLADLPSSADRHPADDRPDLRLRPVPEAHGRLRRAALELGRGAASLGAPRGAGVARPRRPAHARSRVLGGPVRRLRLRPLRPRPRSALQPAGP